MKVVHYEPSELWEIFQKERESLASRMKMIAENPDFDVTLYLTIETKGGMLLPTIVVWIENKEDYRESCIGELDLRQTAQSLYDDYLSDSTMAKRFFDEDDEELKQEEEASLQQDEIDYREAELYDAVSDLLYVVTGGKLEKLAGFKQAEEITDDIVNRVCEHLYTEYGISVFRPMILRDDHGEEFYEEYPYDCMVFEESE